MKTNSLEKVTINDSEQWLLVRGKSDGPLIIQVQAGPGFPMIPEAGTMEKKMHLESDYLVAYWDQRGCGKSFSKETDPRTIHLSQLADDVLVCTKYLLRKYQKRKAIIIGYSIGATLALMAASKDSSMFDRLFFVGIDIDIPTANKFAIDFALSKTKQNGKDSRVKRAIDLSKISIDNSKQFQKRAKLLADLGGIKMNSSYNQLMIASVSNMLFSKAYRFSDIAKTIKGMEFSQDALLPEFNRLNLFEKIHRVDVPVFFFHGLKDAVSPYGTAVKYYEYLRADKKTFRCFDNSAHMPHYDEPAKFAKLLKGAIAAAS